MLKAVNVEPRPRDAVGAVVRRYDDAQPSDRLYNCLPMYHSVGVVCYAKRDAVAGGSLVARRFSASQF